MLMYFETYLRGDYGLFMFVLYFVLCPLSCAYGIHSEGMRSEE